MSGRRTDAGSETDHKRVWEEERRERKRDRERERERERVRERERERRREEGERKGSSLQENAESNISFIIMPLLVDAAFKLLLSQILIVTKTNDDVCSGSFCLVHIYIYICFFFI